MKTHAKISPRGEIELTDNQRIYLKDKHAGKSCFVEIDERTNSEKIGFIEGPITQFFFYQHQMGVYENFKDARNGLKWATDYTEFELDDKGRKIEKTRSMAYIYANNGRTQSFIDKCEAYFRENGYEFPDSEHFKNFRDTNTDIDAVYPPVARLKEKYLEQVKSNLPKWRQ